ncbi:3-oxoacyl-[acyl-carrier-protein] synthase II [Pullulanibacillus pueri]|uniref:3-oxoacyl-[acyl-carrier-protein] synthase 2 n=1 Tax=Pullulanibacillus pueri TaxID=1437324 RepID=A0A8J2ZVB8_9BACL|nr:beta-ketoacyl-ACP synthase II [Pullulanibacillus pueri]MBM7682056.1 3-oxoacyl-[acyl-carrier-protein] synthase II [Pullulanibacillus pueri]GGH80145.1 3-oxoacyl-[acyl-carrier-protein] synthase 2 [Pullulanibacillus pueri]
MKRVVITGMGVISPLGHEVDVFWDRLVAGHSGISTIDTFDVSESKVKIAGLVRDFDPVGRWGRREARKYDRFVQYAMAAAEIAVEDSGLKIENTDPERVGVYVGSGIGGIQTLLENVELLNKRGPKRVSPSLVPMMIANMAPAQISIRFGAQGPSMSPVTACSIGNTSIGESFNTIIHGDADVMIAGGAEAAITPISLASFTNSTALSSRNDDPTRASRPFDANRDGFVMGEGAGVLILESLEHALKREAPIYGEIIGYGASSDAHHVVAPHPEGTGAYLAMKRALQRANITTKDIDVISAHATSTIAGDFSETMAIKRLFGEDAYNIPVTANKSMLGHMFGAGGGAEAIALIKTLQEGIIPPTINLDQPDEGCDLDYVPNVAREADVTIGLSNSFGFGGHNASIVLKKYE